MKGLKVLTAVLAVTAIGASAVPAAAKAPSSTGGSPFRHYIACGIERTSKPAHTCPKRSKKGAFFKSLNADVVYASC